MTKVIARLPLWLVVALSIPLASSLNAISTTVVISEFRVRGPNGGSDEFVELHNRSAAPVDIGGWKIRGSNSSGTVSTRATIEPGTILAPGCFYLLTNSATSGGPYSGLTPGDQTYPTGITDDGGIAVTLPDDITIVDQVGLSTGSAYKEGTPLASLGSSNQNRSYERLPGGISGHSDSDNNVADFQLLSASNPQNSESPCITLGALSVDGNATPNPVIQLESVLITAIVTPGQSPASTGLTAAADLSTLGGDAAQPLFDDGSNGDVTAGDNTFSYQFAVSSTPGNYNVSVGVSDLQGRTAGDTFVLGVIAPPTIQLPHDIQGPTLTSSFVGQSVTVEGVVTGRRSNGVFIQTSAGLEDADPLTSEGLFVFTNSAPPDAVTVGRLVHTTGTVAEFSGDGAGLTLTQLTGSPTFTVFGDEALPAPVPLTESWLSPDGPITQLEPLESMMVSISSMTSTSGTDGAFFTNTGGEASGIATSNGVFFAVLSTTPRPVREPGLDPLIASTFASACAAGPPCDIPVFDGNPERLRVDSDALGAPLQDVTSGVVFTDLVGIVDSGFATWGLLPVPASPGIAGSNVAPIAVSVPGPTQFTVASFNMQRFFDTVNDAGISDVALTPANYANRLVKASLIIRTALRMPDILAVQEVENIGVLNALAAKVNEDAGLPGEYTAYLAEGNDPGGIDVGFLVRARVHVSSVTQEGKTTTFIDPQDGSEDLLNDRPPLVLRAIVDGPPDRLDANIIVVANHLRSLNDVETQARVRAKRQKQAEFLAALLESLQDEGPVVSVGDYNAFEFSDGLVDSIGTVLGVPTAPDQAVVASPDLVEPNLFLTAPGVYSYVFDGNAQTLDHVIVSSQALLALADLQHARINADFPEVYRNDPMRIERLSDHDPAVAFFEFPLDLLAPVISGVPADITTQATGSSGAVVDYQQPTAQDNVDGVVPVTCTPASGSTFPIGTTTVTCEAVDAAGNRATETFDVIVTNPGTRAVMAGAGRLNGPTDLTFTFLVGESGSNEAGALVATVRQGRRTNVFASLQITSVFFSDDPTYPGSSTSGGVDTVVFSGSGWWNGASGYTFDARAADRGTADTFSLIVRSPAGAVVLQATGTLRSGAIQVLR